MPVPYCFAAIEIQVTKLTATVITIDKGINSMCVRNYENQHSAWGFEWSIRSNGN